MIAGSKNCLSNGFPGATLVAVEDDPFGMLRCLESARSCAVTGLEKLIEPSERR